MHVSWRFCYPFGYRSTADGDERNESVKPRNTLEQLGNGGSGGTFRFGIKRKDGTIGNVRTARRTRTNGMAARWAEANGPSTTYGRFRFWPIVVYITYKFVCSGLGGKPFAFLDARFC